MSATPTPPTAPPTARGAMPKGDSVPTSRLAISSLLCGFVGFVLPLVNLTAILLGAIAMVRLNRAKGERQGHGYAIAGMVLGLLGAVMNFFVIMMVIGMFFGIQQTIAQSTNTQRGPNLTALHAAFTQFADEHGRYPTHAAEIVAAGGPAVHTFVDENFFIEKTGRVLVGEYDFFEYVGNDASDEAVMAAIETLDADAPFYRFGRYEFARLPGPTGDGTIIVAWSDVDTQGIRMMLWDDGNWSSNVEEDWAVVWSDDAKARPAYELPPADPPPWSTEE